MDYDRAVGGRLTRRTALFSCILVMLATCAWAGEAASGMAPDRAVLDRAYAAAVADAREPKPEEIFRDLLAITKATPGLAWDGEGRVLMNTWTRSQFYGDSARYQPGARFPLYGDTFFTAYPALQRFCRASGLVGAALALRLEQWLGLPPGGGRDVFLQVWVDPKDLFRPCPDPAIGDGECQVEIALVDPQPRDTPWDCTPGKPQVSAAFVTVSEDHRQWMCQTWRARYGKPDPLANYPWTALGYTYDWGKPGDPVGASEYVALAGAEVVFESVTPVAAYCTAP